MDGGNGNTALGSSAAWTGADLVGSNNTFIGADTNFTNTGISNATAIGAGTLVSQSNTVILGNGANVGIGTSTPSQKLHVSGNVLATSYLTSSDRTLKTHIVPLSGSLEKILSLHGYSFDWKADGRADI